MLYAYRFSFSFKFFLHLFFFFFLLLLLLQLQLIFYFRTSCSYSFIDFMLPVVVYRRSRHLRRRLVTMTASAIVFQISKIKSWRKKNSKQEREISGTKWNNVHCVWFSSTLRTTFSLLLLLLCGCVYCCDFNSRHYMLSLSLVLLSFILCLPSSYSLSLLFFSLIFLFLIFFFVFSW